MQESSGGADHSGPGQAVVERTERRKLTWAPLKGKIYKTVWGRVGEGETDRKESAVKLWLPNLWNWTHEDAICWGLGTSGVSTWRRGARYGRLGSWSSEEILVRALLAQQQSTCGPGRAPWKTVQRGTLRVNSLNKENCRKPQPEAVPPRTALRTPGATAGPLCAQGAASAVRLPLASLLCAGCWAQPSRRKPVLGGKGSPRSTTPDVAVKEQGG